MICLGIESTAHTYGVGIVDDRKILANVTDSYTTKSGGIIPWEASQHHLEVCSEVTRKAIKEGGIAAKDIDLIAFSQGPGIGSCLRVGALAARTLALSFKKPLIGVNHCIAHLEIGKHLTGLKDPVLLYVSGGNTQIIALDAGRYRIFGETLDIGRGNLLDAFGRHIGIGFPGGPKIAQFALKGKDYIELPYVVKGMDLSFGGILTNLKVKVNSGKYRTEDLCYSLQETVYAMCVEVSERAMAHGEKSELVLGGGVGCNKRLQQMCTEMCEDRGAVIGWPDNEFLVDNGAMIAHTGLVMHGAGLTTQLKKSMILPYQRTDEVEVEW